MSAHPSQDFQPDVRKCYSMSLPVMSRWRLVLCEQKRQLVHSEGENNIDMSGLGCENPSVGSFLLFKCK